MDGFSYHNIFDTKGIEYLAVIAFLLLLIPFWLALNKQFSVKEQFKQLLGTLSFNVLKIPQGIFYSKNHTWAYLEKSGAAKVGLDDLLMHITGEVSIRHLKSKDEIVNKGDLIAILNQNGKTLNVFSPLSGKITSTNIELNEKNDLLKTDPYGKGWIYAIQPSNWMVEVSSCYLAEEGTGWMKNELERYKDFLAINLSRSSGLTPYTILQDGGEISDNSLADLPVEFWLNFQKEFLNPEDE
jgi:glycine cleavage system H protein